MQEALNGVESQHHGFIIHFRCYLDFYIYVIKIYLKMQARLSQAVRIDRYRTKKRCASLSFPEADSGWKIYVRRKAAHAEPILSYRMNR